MRRRAALLTALAVAACGDLPQPFRHTAPNPLLDPTPLAGVTVPPVIDAPEPAALAEIMAAALVAHDVVATTGGLRSGGMTVEALVANDDDAVLVSWQLRRPDGVLIREHVQRVPLAVWRTWDGRAATARAAAPMLAAALHESPGATAAAASPLVSVAPVVGAPGDGATALAAAMVKALQRAGLRVGDAPGAFTIAGSVSVSPGPAGQDRLDLAWTVRGPDGQTLGTVTQGNPVPHGSLAGTWGRLARLISDAAADGVVEVVRSGSARTER